MWRLLLGTMGVKSLVQGLNAAATAGFEPRTVWSEVRRRNRLATAPPFFFFSFARSLPPLWKITWRATKLCSPAPCFCNCRSCRKDNGQFLSKRWHRSRREREILRKQIGWLHCQLVVANHWVSILYLGGTRGNITVILEIFISD